MPPDAQLLAIRFGYGLPLPDGAPVDAQAALRLFRGPDLAARALPAPPHSRNRRPCPVCHRGARRPSQEP